MKYSVNLKGSIPSSVKVFTDQSYVSEDLASAELINNTDCIEGNIVVFDRGIQSRTSFDKFTDISKWFVSRGNPNIKYAHAETNAIGEKTDGSTVKVTSDQTCVLFAKGKESKHKYRVIRGLIDASGIEICFITNIMDESAYLIAGWYKQRWEIETFFKFLKQHLNVKYLVSRDPNGIKVIIYMTMILAILIIAYKKINDIEGFKIAKLKFELDWKMKL